MDKFSIFRSNNKKMDQAASIVIKTHTDTDTFEYKKIGLIIKEKKNSLFLKNVPLVRCIDGVIKYPFAEKNQTNEDKKK